MKKVFSLFVYIGLSASTIFSATAQEPLQPIEPATNINDSLAELGKKLYFDPRLSKSGFISCNSCHNLSMGGTDNIATSIGHGWHQGPINAPTVLNSSYNIKQFWDGRAATLQDQAGGPIANPGEMASTHELAINVLASIPQYQQEFSSVFNNAEISINQVTLAIAEFEKTLVTPNSRFDLWLKGDKSALNDQEEKGYQLFKNSGCVGCHSGPAVGAQSFMKMGLVHEYKTTNPNRGLEEYTGNPADRLVFKVPTLRNIELTYPYFHDGQVDTLEEAVITMAWTQLGRKFERKEVDDIVAFLKTLTGEQPRFALPILPPSSNNTPRAEPFTTLAE